MSGILDFLSRALGSSQPSAQPTAQPSVPSQMISAAPQMMANRPIPTNPHYERNKQFAKAGPYVTTLAPQEESKFEQWVKQNKVPMENDGPTSDYDMRGFWKALQSGDPRAKSAINPVDKRLHFPDVWKTPYHPSFSNESVYATPDNPFHWKGETLMDKRTGKPIYETKPQ